MELEHQTPERKDKVTVDQIEKFVTASGFILEMEIGKILEDVGYRVFPNQYFLDYDENKKREVDIVASKTVNEINIVFVIECKQNTKNDWIFVCSNKKPSRYYDFVKFFPVMPPEQSADKTKIFNGLRILNNNLPIAQNSIIRHVNGKQSDSRDIYECITKLPKALVGLVETIGIPEKRTIFFPVAVFSGQMFTVEYVEKLKITEVEAIQCTSDLDSDNYKYHYNYNRLSVFADNSENNTKKGNTPGADLNFKLGSRYLIDFVTKKGIKNFISNIENEISKIDISLWSIN